MLSKEEQAVFRMVVCVRTLCAMRDDCPKGARVGEHSPRGEGETEKSTTDWAEGFNLVFFFTFFPSAVVPPFLYPGCSASFVSFFFFFFTLIPFAQSSLTPTLPTPHSLTLHSSALPLFLNLHSLTHCLFHSRKQLSSFSGTNKPTNNTATNNNR